MLILGVLAIQLITLVLLLLLLRKRFPGGSGPVIIITPPPDESLVSKVLKWELEDPAGTPVKFTSYNNLNGTMPDDLLQELRRAKVDVKLTSSKPNNVAFSKLTLTQASGNVITISKDGSRLHWKDTDKGDWGSSGGEIYEWPDVLQQPVDVIEFLDGNGVSYGWADIQSITFRLR
jgi:hypothetical protein